MKISLLTLLAILGLASSQLKRHFLYPQQNYGLEILDGEDGEDGEELGGLEDDTKTYTDCIELGWIDTSCYDKYGKDDYSLVRKWVDYMVDNGVGDSTLELTVEWYRRYTETWYDFPLNHERKLRTRGCKVGQRKDCLDSFDLARQVRREKRDLIRKKRETERKRQEAEELEREEKLELEKQIKAEKKQQQVLAARIKKEEKQLKNPKPIKVYDYKDAKVDKCIRQKLQEDDECKESLSNNQKETSEKFEVYLGKSKVEKPHNNKEKVIKLLKFTLKYPGIDGEDFEGVKCGTEIELKCVEQFGGDNSEKSQLIAFAVTVIVLVFNI